LQRASMEGQSVMTDNPVELDEHRGMAAQKSTELRRRLHEVQADQAALRRRQEEFERHALAAPSTTWAEAAAEARYLILLFAETSEARNPRRQELIAKGARRSRPLIRLNREPLFQGWRREAGRWV
jgi:hypothetical protein